MRGGVAVWTGCAVLLLSGVTLADTRARHQLTDEEFRAEMARNRALASYVARNGAPDVADVHALADRPPWDDHEVTLYYLNMRKEIGFARAFILDRPEIQIERYERSLTDAQIASLSMRAHRPGGDPMARAGDPTARAEDAARRAETAANRLDAAADSAERAADRAEAASRGMEGAFHRALRK